MGSRWETVVVDAFDPRAPGALVGGGAGLPDRLRGARRGVACRRRRAGLVFVAVDEPKAVQEPAAHRPNPDDRDAEVERLVDMGARHVDVGQADAWRGSSSPIRRATSSACSRRGPAEESPRVRANPAVAGDSGERLPQRVSRRAAPRRPPAGAQRGEKLPPIRVVAEAEPHRVGGAVRGPPRGDWGPHVVQHRCGLARDGPSATRSSRAEMTWLRPPSTGRPPGDAASGCPGGHARARWLDQTAGRPGAARALGPSGSGSSGPRW